MSTDTEPSIPLESEGAMPVPLEPVALSASLEPPDDRRSRMPEPLPVRLVTVEDARLVAVAGIEPELDAFYVVLLGFEREPYNVDIVYRAENFRLIFELIESPVVREDMRPLGIEVLSLREAEQKLIDAKLEYARQKALNPGQESLLLQDPVGNWIELTAPSRLM